MNAMQLLTAVGGWAKHHPELVWPIVSGLFVLLFKKRSPEDYAALAARHPVWLFARFAAFTQLVGALGIDPLKAAGAIAKLFWGTDKPPTSPPSGPSAVGVLIVGVVLSVSAAGCSLFTAQNAQKLIDAGKVACIVEHAFLDDATMNKVCDVVTAAEQAAAKDIARNHREAVGKRMAAMHAEVCSDAGADAR